MTRHPYIKNLIAGLAICLVVAAAPGCGGQDTISANINGENVELPVDGVDILSGGFGGVVAPANIGVPLSGVSLSILIRFINGNITDLIRFDIFDAGVILPGQQLFVDQSNIIGELYLQGQSQFVPPNSSTIIFDEVGIADGQRVSGRFQLLSPVATMIGEFSGTVRVSF